MLLTCFVGLVFSCTEGSSFVITLTPKSFYFWFDSQPDFVVYAWVQVTEEYMACRITIVLITNINTLNNKVK